MPEEPDKADEVDVPLLVGPAWFLEKMRPAMLTPGRWCLPRLYRVGRDVPDEAIRAGVALVWQRHEALRSAFTREPGGGWRQSIAPADTPPPLRGVDVTHLSEAEAVEEATSMIYEVQGAMNVDHGPLVRFLHFHSDSPQRSLLAVVPHHLVSDLISITVIRSELEKVLGRWDRGGVGALAPRGPSYRAHARAVLDVTRSPQMERQLDYWLGQPWDQMVELPCDTPTRGVDSASSWDELRVTVGREELEHPTSDLREALGAQAQWFVLGALSEVLTAWAGGGVCFEVVDQGRNVLGSGSEAPGELQLPRTPLRLVGWLAAGGVIPMLPRQPEEDLVDYVRAAQRLALAVPNRGTGMSLLRWVAPATREDERIAAIYRKLAVRFNYFGGPGGADAKEDELLEPVGLEQTWRPDPLEPRFRLQVAAHTERDALHIRIEHDPWQYRRETIEFLAQEIRKVIIATAGATT